METIRLLDAQGLELFNKLLNPPPPAVAFDTLSIPYKELELRLHALIGRQEDDAIDSLITNLEDGDRDWFRWMQNPDEEDVDESLPLSSFSLIEDVMDAYRWQNLREEAFMITCEWKKEFLGDAHLVAAAPPEFSNSTTTIAHPDRRREEQEWVNSERDGFPREVRALAIFGSQRHQYGYMWFPGESAGQTPEMDLAVCALTAVYEHQTGYDGAALSLSKGVAHYLSRLTLCSAGHIVTPGIIRDAQARLGFPIPGETSGKPSNNLPRMMREYQYYGRQLIGCLPVTQADAAPHIELIRGSSYVKIINT